jgi:ribosomal protein S17E
VLEVSTYFERYKPKAAERNKPPWSEYRTRAEAEQSIERCERLRQDRRKRQADGERDVRRAAEEQPTLGMLIGRHFEFESPRQDGQGGKQSMNTTVITGRSVAKDPRSLIVFYRSHLGGLGNLLESILHNRKPSAKDIVVQADLSATNLIRDPELLERFNFRFIGCSAHARRPFALYEHEDPVYCAAILHEFTGLAMHEQRLDAHGRNRHNVLAVRQTESRRCWERIAQYATKLVSRWSKASKLGAGARYILKHYDKLTAYLDDPRMEPTNNLRERMLRTEKLIENSSMFRKSLEGRFTLDIIRTVLQTAVAARVPIHQYLVSLLSG